MHRQGVLILLWLLISGCATVSMREEYAALADTDALEARYYDVDIPLRDGVRLRATVFQPALKPGETAPLIISAHGFGGFRTSGPMSFYGQFMVTGEASLNAWRHGYWVISYDQRGFGDSGGNIEMMDPVFEPRDLMEVVTWANRNVPRLTRESPDDPVVGTLGESWGGGVQLLASVNDPRIDTLVPITTWHNLADAFAPNDAVRTYWGAVLMTAGTFSSVFDFGKSVQEPYRAMFAGDMTPEARAAMERSSLSTYCARRQYPQADMLLLQGFSDTIMTMNHAVDNQRCAAEGGRDARLVAIQSGHRLPWPTQSINGMPLFHTDAHVDCGSVKYDTLDLIQQWYDLKLKGIAESHPIPRLCVTLPDEAPGFVPPALVEGGAAFPVSVDGVKLVQSGWFEVVMDPLDRLTSWLAPADDKAAPRGGMLRPLFRPLWTAPRTTPVVGMPVLDIEVTGTGDDNRDVVYAAVGVRRQGSHAVTVISDQFMPIVGNGRHQLTLPGISEQLSAGDSIGLVLQGYTGQFFFNPEGWFASAEVRGSLALPLLERHDDEVRVASLPE